MLWGELVEGGRSYQNFGFVHPDWRRRGIGGALHRHDEKRLREIAAGHPGVAPKWFESEGVDTDLGNAALLRGSGYRPVRFFFDMVLPSLDAVGASPMPAGIELRPTTREQYRTIWVVAAEAFRDHWGATEWAEEDWARFEADPENADPGLWRVAWDGDEVAGVVLTTVPAAENDAHGRARVYVGWVAVRRPWRRRGLARALLDELARRSQGGGLHVGKPWCGTRTAQTGATGLYESIGFRPEKTFTTYRKLLSA